MRQPFERLLVGRKLAGRYELAEAVGAGGMSVVYRGTDLVLGRPVAVKVVGLPADSEEMRANLRERFRREAASAARITHHPNVVQVYDYGTDAELDLDFIVMELLRGRDLKEALRHDSLPRAEAVRVLIEAARGLAAGHQEGIVHRDVKPANVFLVGEDGRLEYVRVLDFGIAKPVEPDEESLTLTGIGQLPHSPAYASPEQLDPDAPVSPASDVYQLGLIAYELLTGARPYGDPERQRIRDGAEVPPADTARWATLAAPLRTVVSRALRRDPAARYPDATAFADALEAADGVEVLGGVEAEDDDDRTVLVHSADDAATQYQPSPPMPPVALPEPVEPVPAAPRAMPSAPLRGRRFAPPAWAIPLVLLVLAIAVWASRRNRTPAAVSATMADTGAIAALHDKFLRLQGQVAASEEDAPPAAVPEPAAAPQTAEEGERAKAAAVQTAVLDMHAAWSAGELDRMMSHYADRVDYYNVEGQTKSFVREDRARTIQRYPRREITIESQATMFEEPDLARVMVTKSWTFVGSGERWTGRMRQELKMRNVGGQWLIVSEKTNRVYDQDRQRI